jgi:hypothetical protein
MDNYTQTDPICALFVCEEGTDHFEYLDRTELIEDERNPTFRKRFRVSYRRHEDPLLKLVVFDGDPRLHKGSRSPLPTNKQVTVDTT